MLIWGEYGFSNEAIASTSYAPPNETPAGVWDTWDFRGLWNQPHVQTEFALPTMPLLYPQPWQVYPR